MNQRDFDDKYRRIDVNKRVAYYSKDLEISITPITLPKILLGKFLSFFPFLTWMPKYKISNDLFHDLVAGLTVGIMAVPQGLAYSQLANVDPVYGLYSTFFAPMFYFFFGTSRHIVIGVLAVVSMMVGNCVTTLIQDKQQLTTSISNVTAVYTRYYSNVVPFEISPTTLISTLTFTVSLYQIGMAALRLSFLTHFMSDQLISGFTTGSAFHVLIAQFGKIIGVKLPRRKGMFMLPRMIADTIIAIPQSNLLTVGMSTFGLVFLFITREYFNPWFARYSRIPIPFELLLVLVMTCLSYFLDLHDTHHVSIVKHIPEGIPVPALPNVKLIPYIWMDALTLSITCYMFVISMGKLFAKKHRYKIDANQELYALGFSSLLSSFFPVYPAGGSLSRSSVCEMSGARSQVYVIFTTLLLLVVILWLGPLLEPLPMCILACIVIISLKGLFMQFAQLKRLWRISKYDFMIWVISCGTTFLSDPSIGIIISFTFVLFSVVLREQWPRVQRLYATPNFDTFKDGLAYQGLTPVGNGIVVLKFESALHFANCEQFKDKILEVVEDPDFRPVFFDKNSSLSSDDEVVQLQDSKFERRLIIIDCSGVCFIDTMGAEVMCETRKIAAEANTQLVYADIPEPVLDVLLLKDFKDFLPFDALYPTVREAMKAAGVERV